MQKILSILVMCFALSFYACEHKNHNAAFVSSQIDSTLKQTIAIMSNSNEKLLMELQKKRYEPCTQLEVEQGLYFSSKLQQASDTLLEKVKEMEDGLRKPEVSVDDFFGEQGKGNELQKSIKAYKQALLKIDSIVTKEFADTISKLPETIIVKGVDLYDGLIQLSNLRTQVYLMQNKMMRFFVMRTYVLCCGMRTVSEFLVTQSSNIVFAGDKLKITAGIVAFQWQAQPAISINDKKVDASSGEAVYQMKVPNIPGEYDVPVKIQYKDQATGQLKTATRKVHYTVIKKEE